MRSWNAEISTASTVGRHRGSSRFSRLNAETKRCPRLNPGRDPERQGHQESWYPDNAAMTQALDTAIPSTSLGETSEQIEQMVCGAGRNAPGEQPRTR